MYKQNKNMKLIYTLLKILEIGNALPASTRPHRLKGNWKIFMECHIQPDWLLIWKEDKEKIYLARTGSHSDLFDK
jgi:mRNA interferase YafQ